MADFQGINSVIDRTLFTNKGPIVKRPVPLLAGVNLRVLSETDVEIPTGSFTSSEAGLVLDIFGSAGGRNDLTNATVSEVLSSTRLRLEGVNLSILDEALTEADVVALANHLRSLYEAHRIQGVTVDGAEEGVHATLDTVNSVAAPAATDLASAVTLLNDLKAKFGTHVLDVTGDPPVHGDTDPDNVPEQPDASQLGTAIQLVNDLRRKYEAHRQDRFIHQNPDSVNPVTVDPVSPTVDVYPGPLTGPLGWTLKDPRYGLAADDPTDVEVTVNGSPAAVETVYGLLGAVVLADKPGGGDEVLVDYDWISNPPARFLRLNSPEFNLNQWGNRGHAGLPKHRYRSRSFLISGNSPDFMAPSQPRRVGWKYKAHERAYTAVLNDPTSLLLNVPTNRLGYKVLFDQVSEFTVRYDPAVLPQSAVDPWIFEGEGELSLVPGGGQLVVVDADVQTGPDSLPPFFSHELDLRAEAFISSAFRVRIPDDPTILSPDGVFTGVSFGISDGQRAAVVGFVTTDATNLSSAIVMANDARARFDAHLTNTGSHNPDDPSESVDVVPAFDLTSLVILLNELKARFNAHIAKGSGVGSVHQTADSVNGILEPDASDEASAIALANAVRTALNAHRGQPTVHFSNDVVNVVDQVRQVGILLDGGFPEFQGSWRAAATDWTEFQTYRLFLSETGDASLFLAGSVVPAVEVDPLELPSLSDLTARFDAVQQTFFGSISREATSESRWQFIRVNVNPTDGNLIEDNKAVDYGATVLPELDPSAPWINVGQGGIERILSPDVLLLDSTSSAPNDLASVRGRASGAFRGFVRLEPILTRSTAASFEFRTAADYYTHGLSNSAYSVVLDDDNYTVQLSFLQFDPSPATVTGSATEPLTLVQDDSMVVKVGSDPSFPVTFGPGSTTTVAAAVAQINADAGFTLADEDNGRIRLTAPGLGAETSLLEIISGSALGKLGFSPGTYFGKDSNPEPRISWFGEDLPDLDDPVWGRGGTQGSTMLGRTMRLTDSSSQDFVTFSLDDPVVTNQSFNSSVDWKLDARLTVRTFIAGDSVPAVGPYSTLSFAGVLLSVDEGSTGKNVELHLATDGSGGYFLNLLSFNPGTGELDVVSQYAFNWNDGQVHSYNVYTSKAVDSLIVLADGIVLSPSAGPAPTYSGLNSGVTAGPSVSFGSGSNPVVGTDLRSAQSVVDWRSVAIFRDSKIGDPTSSDRRFIGIFKGGDPSLLSSYYLHQIDWGVLHTYRIVRDPSTSVSVYVDGGAVPAISVPYDVLTLPPVSSSFLIQTSSGRPTVAFGSFSPRGIARTRWDFVRYSLGRITLTDRLVPPNHVLNQHNVVNSPDHLFTTKVHNHQGFTVYSGGTVLDDFMSDEEVASYTELGEGTPPVPRTQDLESRGGMIKVATPLESIASLDLVNTRGFITDLEDDTANAITEPAATDLPAALALLNDWRTKYLSHVVQYRVHLANDDENVILPPEASDLAGGISLANAAKEQFNLHLAAVVDEVQRVHSNDDVTNVVTAPDATDLASLQVLADDLAAQYEAHRIEPDVHGNSLFIRLDPPDRVLYEGMKFWTFEDGDEGLVYPFSDDETLHLDGITVNRPTSVSYSGSVLPEDEGERAVRALANDLKAVFNAHRTEAGVHPSDDLVNPVASPDATDLPSALTLLAELKARLAAHVVEPGVHVADDPPNEPFATDPTEVKTALALAGEIRLKFERHRLSGDAHSVADDVNVTSEPDPPPVADPGWRRFDDGPGTAGASLVTAGPDEFLRYGTTVSPMTTLYRKETGIPDSPSVAFTFTVRMRVNSYTYAPDVDTGIYAGFLSSIGPGVAAAIGFEGLNNVPHVKLQDVNADEARIRIPFNWDDGAFHTYRIVRHPGTDTFRLVIVE